LTFISQFGYTPNIRKQILGPLEARHDEISIVIPVKDNQRGIETFLESFFQTQDSQSFPKEIIIVDSSELETSIPPFSQGYELPISVIHCNEKGPAVARNLGWKKARGTWILFTDSDCIPQKQWIEGYFEAINGSLGYAGIVKAHGSDIVSQYYESQKILIPPPFQYKGITYPEFLITANALVWKPALKEIQGFNETIQIAAGEDVDLGFRLREIGNISYAPNSIIHHNFDDGLKGFIKRFKRYGEGNKKIAELYTLDMKPKPFKPIKKTLANYFLACFQYYYLYKGYMTK
jgi:glycosyltransferase involved in cell wall biosynthesis